MKKYIIGFFRPCDFITMTSTSLAIIAMMLTFSERYSLAVLLLGLCGICDAYDGKVARMRKNTREETEYGIQMDSLNDVVAFGVLPAIITASVTTGIIPKIICVFYVLCGLIRLAYFNMLEETQDKKKPKKKGYIGIPITTIAIVYPIPYILCRLNGLEQANIVLPIILLIMGILFIVRINIPKVDFPNIFSKIFNKYLVNFVYFPFLVIFGMNLFFNLTVCGRTFETVIYTFTSFKYILVFIMLYLIIVSLLVLLSSIFNSFKISKIIIALLTVVLAVVNDIKYKSLLIPIVLSDVSYLNPDNIKMMGTSTTTYGPWIYEILIKGIVFILLFGVLIILNIKSDIKFKNIKKRLISLFVSLLVFISIILFISNCDKFIINNIYKEKGNTASTVELYKKYGITGGLIIENTRKKLTNDSRISKDDATVILNTQKETDNKWGNANIIFVLSESYFDIDNIKEISFDKDTNKFFNSLENKDNSDTFNIITPAYGGGSVNAEFEVLTGSNLLNLWYSDFIPYNSYYVTNETKKAPNIMKELNNNDYKTIYFTPWGANSFNSEKVYTIFGADEKYYNVMNDSKYIKGLYLSEDNYMDALINKYEENKSKKTFIMTTTSQNHYPFEANKYKKYDVNIEKTSLDDDIAGKIQSYAQGQYDQDKGLEKLYNYIQSIDEKTIVLYFGDHLPSIIDNNGEQCVLKTSYFNTDNEELNNLRSHTTKGAIFSNFDIDLEDMKDINANYLGSYIINHLDLDISNYFKYVENTRKELPAFYGNNIYKNNKLYNINKLSKDKQNKFNEYKDMEYYMFYGN